MKTWSENYFKKIWIRFQASFSFPQKLVFRPPYAIMSRRTHLKFCPIGLKFYQEYLDHSAEVKSAEFNLDHLVEYYTVFYL